MGTKETGNKKSTGRQTGQQKVRQKKADPLEPLKLEIAAELGLSEKVKSSGWDSLSAREAGKIGGVMTQRLKTIKLGGNLP